ncbi:hypothetical protein [Rubrivivax sp. JA1026]|uniref:hypothetical protein n=1 Tax=Rubrivivax sp. JA1026 TaxID=2710888 RepID=UPI0013E9189E|nr:hypothetical protein [Rubrivivax sp. JA1026]
MTDAAQAHAHRRLLDQAATGARVLDVASELAALRKDIAELRALLAPPSSVILTGPDAMRVFERLTQEGGAA